MRTDNKLKTHEWILEHLTPKSRVIDMTCGNGHDTAFLARHCNHVIAVDIQKTAIEATRNRLESYTNISYLHHDHSTLDFETLLPLHGAIYNLGYLPHSDKTILTTPQTTLLSLRKLYPHLQDFLVITTYRRHEGGLSEHEAVETFLKENHIVYQTLTYNTPLSPVTFLIHK